LNARGYAAYRFTRASVEGADGFTGKQVGNAGEAGIHVEALVKGGFVRAGSWADFGKAGEAPGRYLRQGAFTRYYGDVRMSGHQSFIVDVSATAGASVGDVPIELQFAGGNRIDPFLGDRFHPVSEYMWAGPVYRASGSSSFVGTGGPLQFFVPGGRFGGVSVTLGLPGYSIPLMPDLDAQQRPAVENSLLKEFNANLAQVTERSLRRGASVEQAEQRSVEESRELSETLRSLIRHAHRFSARPFLALDVASVSGNGAAARSALATGLGLRIQSLNSGLELLYMKSVRDSALAPDEGSSNFILRFYVRPRVFLGSN
jgi:hypothetical protein